MPWLSRFNGKAISFNNLENTSLEGHDYRIHCW